MPEVEKSDVDDELKQSEEPTAGSSGECTPYDFGSSGGSKWKQTDSLEFIHSAFAKKASVALSTYLTTDIHLEFCSVEQRLFSDFTEACPQLACVASFDLQPLSGQGLIEVASPVMFAAIDKVLGGTGEAPSEERPFTGLELSVVKQLFRLLLSELRAAWAEVSALSLAVQDVYTDPLQLRTVAKHEQCFCIALKMAFGKVEGAITICLPILFLEAIVHRLVPTGSTGLVGGRQATEVKTQLEQRLIDIAMPVDTVLGSTMITMADLLMMQTGDILRLDNKVKEPADILVGGTVKFKGNPGLVGKYRGTMIQQVVSET